MGSGQSMASKLLFGILSGKGVCMNFGFPTAFEAKFRVACRRPFRFSTTLLRRSPRGSRQIVGAASRTASSPTAVGPLASGPDLAIGLPSVPMSVQRRVRPCVGAHRQSSARMRSMPWSSVSGVRLPLRPRLFRPTEVHRFTRPVGRGEVHKSGFWKPRKRPFLVGLTS